MQTYDAIVIGSGQGGGPLAHKLADLNWKVALIEREHLGGSCINYGCTPTKAMLASARIAHHARRAAEFGVRTGEVSVDLARVVQRKDEIVHSWRDGQEKQADSRETLDLYRGHGSLSGPGTVEVNGETLTAGKIFINTGTRPRVPALDGLDGIEYLTNRNVMDLTELPRHLLVLGGNYLGLEFAQMFRRFGSQVTLVEVNEQIAPREDEDVAASLQEALEAEGLAFRLGAKAKAVTKTEGGLELTIETSEGGNETLQGSHLLMAIGQMPNSDGMGLEKAGVRVDDRGYIEHNERLETSAEGVWVLGDVKGGPAFTHISYDDHLVIYDNLIEGKNRTIADRILPYAMFTDPELGRVGMTEREAREAGHKLKVGSLPIESVARAIERSETRGMMKVVIEAETDRILGAAVLGPEGGDVVQTLMTLMLADAPWTLFRKAMFIHPTMPEGFFSLMDRVKPA